MMEPSLRAFLMMRSVAGSWTVSAHHHFSSVVRVWKTGQDPDQQAAVLHIGLEPPPPESFDELAQAYPGRVLLTVAAKHIVPTPFASSAAPVGAAGSTEVFVGLEGWGYSMEDPTVGTGSLKPSLLTSKDQGPQGWVASFLKVYPSDAAALTARKIHDESTYLNREAGLERAIRHRIGLFRIHHVLGSNCHDPCRLAAIAPPWLTMQRFAYLNLPIRIWNVFAAVGITTVADLANWSAESLLEQPNFGRKSLGDILQILNRALGAGPSWAATGEAIPVADSLLTGIRKSLLSLTDRERYILVRRLGFETPTATLREIAQDYDITYERIRQIEVRAAKQWIHESPWGDILEQKMTRLLTDRSFPLKVADVEVADSWFRGMSSHRVFFNNIVYSRCKGRIHVIEIEDFSYFSTMNQATWERTVSEASALLSDGAGQWWKENHARSLVHDLLPGSAKEFGSLLWDKSSRLCQFITDRKGSRILISYGRGADQLVEAILAESDAPLHFTEIPALAKLRGGKELSVRRAHAAAAKVGLLFGRGNYGLAHHVPLSEDQLSRIRSEAEDIVGSAPTGKQWHTWELLSELTERMDVTIEGLDKYLLNIALAGSDRLRHLGRMTWIAAESGMDSPSRIDLQQAVIATVQSAGRPLSTDEIKERLAAKRGVNKFFQIFPVDPLVRLKPGLWGINERDVPLSRQEQHELIECLIDRLETRQSGIHTDELTDLIPIRDCTPEAFLSIAVQDERLALGQGRYLYLTQWGNSRRETITDAV